MVDNIIFVKHGDKYHEGHVNRLYNQCKEYWPDVQYHCYTEQPIGLDPNITLIPCINKPRLRKWWNKLAMFSDWFPVEGKCLFFDLDMNIKEDPTKYLKWDGLTIIKDYWKDDLYMAPHAYDVHINSSVITWTAGEQTHIWNYFLTNYDYFMRKYKGIDRFIVHENFSHNVFEQGLVYSVDNPNVKYENAPIEMYNGLDYELPRTSI